MDYRKRLQRQIDRRCKEILVTGETALELKMLNEAVVKAGCYVAGTAGISRVTKEHFHWWHLQEPSLVKLSATRSGLVPMKQILEKE